MSNESNGSVCDVKNPIHQKRKRITKNIDTVKESVNENPKQSITCRSLKLELLMALRRIFLIKICILRRKTKVTRDLKPNDDTFR